MLNELKGTSIAEIISAMEVFYNKIDEAQKQWWSDAGLPCPEGCGCCCHHFEPDLLEAEALFMAMWLMENQSETAEKIAQGEFPFDNGDTCPFHDFQNPYHCSIYGGRPALCRLFGASGSRDKCGNPSWKPCKFYPAEKLQQHQPPLSHRQYSESETKDAFGFLPPMMSDLMEPIASLEVGNPETRKIREILPETIRKLLWISSMNENC